MTVERDTFKQGDLASAAVIDQALLSELTQVNTLVAPFQAAGPPKLRDVRAAFEKALGVPLTLWKQPPPRENEKWVAFFKVPGREEKLELWLEPLRPLPEYTIERMKLQGCNWALGAATLLDTEHPVDHQLQLLRMLSFGVPGAPAILDANTGAWFTREELETEILPPDAVVNEQLLFLLHSLCPDEKPTEHSRMWVYTDGLSRCGRPELEMIDVPYAYLGAAMTMLMGLGELMIESAEPLTAVGEPFEIGPGLEVTLRPWPEAAEFVDDKWLGSLKRRENHDGVRLEDFRLAVCGPQAVGSFKKIWTWPREAAERMMQGVAMYRTQRSTQRLSRDARQHWPVFLSAFERAKALAVFVVQAGFDCGGTEQPGREHLLLEVVAVDGNRAQGRLLHEPQAIRNMRKDERVWINPEQVTDWQIIREPRPLRPVDWEEIAAMGKS